MAAEFSFSDVRCLLRQHEDIQSKLSRIESAVEYYSQSVDRAAQQCLTAEVLNVMQDIPVTEVNRDKRGIRVKPLQEAGYATYADVMTASVYQLAALRGISHEGATTIKHIVNDTASKALKTTKLKLSIDNKTQNTTRVVLALCQYQKARDIAEAAKRLSDYYSLDILSAVNELKGIRSRIHWFFTPNKTKQHISESCRYLQDGLQGQYGMTASMLWTETDSVVSCSPTEAWNSFQEKPIQYINILEAIVPGVLGNSDSIYGLPEELAREVQEECFFPDGLLCELRRYQEWGVKYILHQGKVLLGDEMGLGKTVQAIAAMVSLKNTGATHFIVICPASVLINWYREVRKLSKLQATMIHGLSRHEACQDWLKTGGVAVTTYETIPYLSIPNNFRFALLVVDEAHYIKNPEARRSINTIKLSGNAERLLFMTGTPLENKVEEMVNLIRILQPAVARQVSDLQMLSTAPQFREKLVPVYYRRKREDVLTELPELIENAEWCQLGDTEKYTYENAVLSRNYNAARRVSWHVSNLKDSSKAKRMLEIIEEARQDGRKVIVFSFYLDTMQKIASLLGDRCSGPIDGSVSPAKRQDILDDFEKAPAGQVLAAQIMAGGTGLNIQSASVVILCEPQLKPSIENQAISRAYRMGQTRNVLVYRLLADNTIDERITDLLAEKQLLFDSFADESVAAQNVEIDTKSLGSLIQEEIDRINQRRNPSTVPPSATASPPPPPPPPAPPIPPLPQQQSD